MRASGGTELLQLEQQVSGSGSKRESGGIESLPSEERAALNDFRVGTNAPPFFHEQQGVQALTRPVPPGPRSVHSTGMLRMATYT